MPAHDGFLLNALWLAGRLLLLIGAVAIGVLILQFGWNFAIAPALGTKMISFAQAGVLYAAGCFLRIEILCQLMQKR